MAGPRAKNDAMNIEGSGYHPRDRVVVNTSSRQANGFVEAIHAGGKKIDVRIDHPGHPEHGRVVTFAPMDVEPHEDLVKSLGAGKAATSAKD